MAVQEVKWNNVTECRNSEGRRDQGRFRERKIPSVFGGEGRKTWIIKVFWSEKVERQTCL
jgi:hypothetical protein